MFLVIYVTKHMANDTDSDDRPAINVQEIEITPEMIPAGAAELDLMLGAGSVANVGDIDGLIVETLKAVFHGSCETEGLRRLKLKFQSL